VLRKERKPEGGRRKEAFGTDKRGLQRKKMETEPKRLQPIQLTFTRSQKKKVEGGEKGRKRLRATAPGWSIKTTTKERKKKGSKEEIGIGNHAAPARAPEGG